MAHCTRAVEVEAESEKAVLTAAASNDASYARRVRTRDSTSMTAEPSRGTTSGRVSGKLLGKSRPACDWRRGLVVEQLWGMLRVDIARSGAGVVSGCFDP